MSGRFSDSNVLIYLASENATKAESAELILGADLIVSVQVLNEIANVLRRKKRNTWPQIHRFLERVRNLAEVRDLTLRTHRLGLAMAERYQLSVYDGMIVAAALEADCDVLYSEDMHHGLIVEGSLRIVNPFLPN